MSRLIDADKLRKDVLDLPNCYNGFSDTYDKAMIVDLVDEQPTVDAVPVVRCKDCQYSRPKKSGIKLHCAWWYRSVYDDDFCSSGKRRKDGT